MSINAETTPQIPGSTVAFWGEVTDPRYHNPDKFRYLVHTVGALTADSGESFNAAAQALGMGDVSEEQGVDLSVSPELVQKPFTLSTSLIDEEHRCTWHYAGLILGVPAQDIILTSPSDIGVVNGNREIVEKYWLQYHPKRPADELLTQTAPKLNNEVVVVPRQAALQGLFVVTYRNLLGFPKPVDPSMARLMRDHSRRLGLPLVRLPRP